MKTKTYKTSTLILTLLLTTLLQKTNQKCNHLCKQCHGQQCLECKRGHGLAEDQCYACLIEKCEDCSGDPKKCVSCKSYHFYQDQTKECKRCAFGCEECENEEICVKCGFIFKNVNNGKCRISILLLILIVVALIAPCVLVWSATYYFCLKAESKFDEDGKIIRGGASGKNNRNRFTGKMKEVDDGGILGKGKKIFSSFLFDYDKKKKEVGGVGGSGDKKLTKSALN